MRIMTHLTALAMFIEVPSQLYGKSLYIGLMVELCT